MPSPWSILIATAAALAADPVVIERRANRHRTQSRTCPDKCVTSKPPAGPGRDKIVSRAVEYLATIPDAIEGKNGSKPTIWAARIVVYGYDLGVEDGLRLLLDHYNPRCVPPWPEDELRRKCVQADETPFAKPRGWLIQERPPSRRLSPEEVPDGTASVPVRLSNFRMEEIDDGDAKKAIRVGRPGCDILADLADATSGWPKVCDDVPFVPDPDHADGVRWLQKPNQLFAWADRRLGGSGRTGIKWSGRDETCLTKAEFYEYVVQNAADRFDTVAPHPHEPPLPRCYYVNPCPVSSERPGSALAGLMKFLTPATPEDSELIRSLFLTLLWGGPPGSRPAFVITTPESDAAGGRGTGKTTLARLAASLVGGSLQLRQGEDFGKFVTRSLSPEGIAKRVVLVDNVKSTKFSWADLEGFITADVISGSRHYVGEGRRPNYLTTLITVNGPALSKDFAQRCVPIHLDRPSYDATWEAAVNRHVTTHREAILADVLSELRAAPRPFTKPFRWGSWQEGVLSRLVDPDALVGLIHARQAVADEDGAEAALILESVVSAVRAKIGSTADPEEFKAFITAKAMARIATEATGEKRSVGGWGRMVRTMGIKSLPPSGDTGIRGWHWWGSRYQEGSNDIIEIEK